MLYTNKTSPTCEYCHFAPFCDTAEHSMAWMDKKVVKQHYHLKKNETLYLPQNTFRNLYAIRQGYVKTYQIDSDGNELTKGFFFKGEILGFESIYSNDYLCTAVALSDSVVCEIPYDSFLELLQLNPSLQKHILYLMSQQLNVGGYLSLITAQQRLAAFLIDLAHRLSPCRVEWELTMPMSRQDMGNYLKLTAETISRILTQFKESKIIAIDHKKIQILQPDQLKLIAELS